MTLSSLLLLIAFMLIITAILLIILNYYNLASNISLIAIVFALLAILTNKHKYEHQPDYTLQIHNNHVHINNNTIPLDSLEEYIYKDNL